MISFLNPWLWLGVVALGAPIWLHLRRRDREEIIRFSALRFLDDQPVARQAPLQLRNILLFLLRVLAVLLLIAAFARPYFQQESQGVSSSEVYILDNTLSRQAEHGLEHDRAFLLQQIGQAGPREQIAVVELASEPKVVTGFGDSPAQADRQAERAPAHRPSAARCWLRCAKPISSSSNRSASTSTSPSFPTSRKTSGPKIRTRRRSSLPASVSLSPFSGIESRPNFFVGEPKLQRIFIGNDALMQFTAQIGHTGNVTTAAVKLVSNDKEIIKQPIELDAKTPQITVVARWEADPSVWLQGTISVEAKPDDLAAGQYRLLHVSARHRRPCRPPHRKHLPANGALRPRGPRPLERAENPARGSARSPQRPA